MIFPKSSGRQSEEEALSQETEAQCSQNYSEGSQNQGTSKKLEFCFSFIIVFPVICLYVDLPTEQMNNQNCLYDFHCTTTKDCFTLLNIGIQSHCIVNSVQMPLKNLKKIVLKPQHFIKLFLQNGSVSFFPHSTRYHPSHQELLKFFNLTQELKGF